MSASGCGLEVWLWEGMALHGDGTCWQGVNGQTSGHVGGVKGEGTRRCYRVRGDGRSRQVAW